jgi:hypothetical protein
MKGSFGKGKNTLTSARERNLIMCFYYTTYQQLEGNEKQLRRGRISSYPIYYITCIKDLMIIVES